MALEGVAVQEASTLALHQVRLPVFAGDVGRCHAVAALLTVCAMPQQRLYDDQISLHGSPMEQRAVAIAVPGGQEALAVVVVER